MKIIIKVTQYSYKMIYIEQNKLNTEDFIVLDEDNNPITGLILGDFIVKLYNPSKTLISSGISLDELGSGLYRIKFTPDTLGQWELIINHSVYFPYGKAQNYRCVENLGGISPELEEVIRQTLGLSQSNYRILNPQYDRKNNLVGGIIKIYPTAADVDADTNEIATYNIIATYDDSANMTSYKVKKA